MISFAQDVRSCRHQLFDTHFSKHLDTRLPPCGVCDNCRLAAADIVTEDVKADVRSLCVLLSRLKDVNERVTMIKLVEAWKGLGPLRAIAKTIRTEQNTLVPEDRANKDVSTIHKNEQAIYYGFNGCLPLVYECYAIGFRPYHQSSHHQGLFARRFSFHSLCDNCVCYYPKLTMRMKLEESDAHPNHSFFFTNRYIINGPRARPFLEKRTASAYPAVTVDFGRDPSRTASAPGASNGENEQFKARPKAKRPKAAQRLRAGSSKKNTGSKDVIDLIDTDEDGGSGDSEDASLSKRVAKTKGAAVQSPSNIISLSDFDEDFDDDFA
jgi:uncharacterized ParB-like nuclease family protein